MQLEKMEAPQARKQLDGLCDILRGNIACFGDRFCSSNSENGFYRPTDNVEWTTGFTTGEYWLAWEHSADPLFRETAMHQVDSFLARIENKVDVEHHDMGFLYTPSCVAAYKLTGSEKAKRAALLAADNLLARFQPKGQFIQAWGPLGIRQNYRLIIDCLLNLPLLFWAADVTGNEAYHDAALAHTRTSWEVLVRPDHSTFHTYRFDPDTGAPVCGETKQGYRDGSAWARGQAWGIYGAALTCRHMASERYRRLFYDVTDYFLAHLPADGVPYWDLEFTEGPEPRDSSAGAIAACGMLEMAKFLPADRAEYYAGQARRLAAALTEHCAAADRAASNGLLLHGVYAKSSPYNPIPEDRGVDECTIWGDYFYMELLTRIATDWNPYW